MLDIVILAAGKGTRMKSEKSKVLHTIGGQTFLGHVIATAKKLQPENIYVVIGHGAESVKQTFSNEEKVTFVEQKEQLGTGHAVQQVLSFLSEASNTLILYGDVPLIQEESLNRLLDKTRDSHLALLTVTMENPHGYGRIIKGTEGNVTAIVEQKDATEAELAVKEVNTGIMATTGKKLASWLTQLTNDNAQNEYYLTDIVAMAAKEEGNVLTVSPNCIEETLGINDRLQQAALERFFQRKKANELMAAGLYIADPERFDCRGNITFGRDCSIDVNCIFEGDITLGDNVSIGPNCHILSSQISDNSIVKSHSIVEESRIENDVVVGPFARIRPSTHLKNGAKIGNFVETKKAIIGENSKVNHLSYVGDASIGRNVNIGAGTITCNYDGVNKSQTTIGDDVFVGSNSALVAPVELEKGSTVGAGSVITSKVEEGALSVARAKQRNIPGWPRPVKK